jgi:VWFA-related protein
MVRILVALLLLTFSLLSSSTPLATAQDKPKEKPEDEQTIKLATQLIEVRAVVTDKQGKVIEGLTKDDFELLENNKPQEVSFFNFTRIAGRGATPATAPKTAEEITAKAAALPARSVLLFADTLHMTAGNLMSLKQSLRNFLDKQLTEQDLAALVTSYGSLGVGEQFTRDRRLLRYALTRLSVGPSERTSAFTPYLAGMVERQDRQALQEAMRIVQQEDRIDEPRILETFTRNRAREILNIANFRSRQTLLTLRSVVDNLAKMPGQRLLVLFSDGFTTLDNSGTPDMGELQNVISRAVRAGVIIYSIDAAGLRVPPMMSAEYGVMLNSTYASGGESEAQNGLNALAADTGGKFFRNTNDLMGVAAQALSDNEALYTLAYYPNDESKPNNFRKLTVRVKGHPEYKVRTQKGYLPAAFAKAKNTVEAKTPELKLTSKMVEPLATTDLGIFASVADFEIAKEANQATLQVTIDAKTLTYKPVNDRQQFEVKVVVMAFDSNGKRVFGSSETLQGNLLPARKAAAERTGINLMKRLELKPGFYQVRVGLLEPSTERMGTANAIVQVPDLKRKQLTLSAVMLTDQLEDLTGKPANPTAQSPVSVKAESRFVQGIPFFQPSQNLIYYFQLYTNAPSAAKPEDLSLEVEIWLEDKKLVTAPAAPLPERLIGRDEKGLTVGGQLVLSPLPTGLYELRLTVRGQGKKTVATRTALFGVEK